MTASETLKIIAKQWCNLSDLMKLAGVGRNNALVIKSTIKKKLESENYYVPNNAVPMQEVVKYLNIDINFDGYKGIASDFVKTNEKYKK